MDGEIEDSEKREKMSHEGEQDRSHLHCGEEP